MNRASMALAFAALLVAIGAIRPEEALAAVDLGTIILLLAMMLVVANLRIAGFFTAAGAGLLSVARTPRALLALVVAAAGFLSALFLNDTVCLMLTPLVVELATRSERDPVPYLVGLATAANVGSCATIIGNPQNMLIGASSGISFLSFLSRLGPLSIICLGVCWLAIVAAFPREFAAGTSLRPAAAGGRAAGGEGVDRRLVAKSLGATALMIALLLAGVPAALAAMAAAAILLFTRRISPERVFAQVDFSLLAFFGGLFIITKSLAGTRAFGLCVDAATPLLRSGGNLSLASFSALSLVASNLVSNVPTVMLFRPLVPLFADTEKAWLILAMASTYAGNLTLLGSVANLIVAEGARPHGVSLSFGKYLRAGLPITLVTVAAGTLWILAS
jgi:Na+/H+ antiporter NhaD/arsenite permease-like protein